MIQSYAQPPLFGTEPVEDDELFTLIDQTCQDCGQAFQSSRRSPRCALCAALRSGEVGPATVVCPVCDLEHKIPVLSPTKLCGPCRADPEIAASSLHARLDAAQVAAAEAWTRLDADLAHADAADRARYDVAMERAQAWDAARWARARDAAIAAGDGLSPLLAARVAWDEAAQALDATKAAVALGLEEVERARL